MGPDGVDNSFQDVVSSCRTGVGVSHPQSSNSSQMLPPMSTFSHATYGPTDTPADYPNYYPMVSGQSSSGLVPTTPSLSYDQSTAGCNNTQNNQRVDDGNVYPDYGFQPSSSDWNPIPPVDYGSGYNSSNNLGFTGLFAGNVPSGFDSVSHSVNGNQYQDMGSSSLEPMAVGAAPSFFSNTVSQNNYNQFIPSQESFQNNHVVNDGRNVGYHEASSANHHNTYSGYTPSSNQHDMSSSNGQGPLAPNSSLSTSLSSSSNVNHNMTQVSLGFSGIFSQTSQVPNSSSFDFGLEDSTSHLSAESLITYLDESVNRDSVNTTQQSYQNIIHQQTSHENLVRESQSAVSSAPLISTSVSSSFHPSFEASLNSPQNFLSRDPSAHVVSAPQTTAKSNNSSSLQESSASQNAATPAEILSQKESSSSHPIEASKSSPESSEVTSLIQTVKCFKCTLCDVICLLRTDVLSHIQKEHQSKTNGPLLKHNEPHDPPSASDETSDSLFSCDSCPQVTFDSFESWRQHMSTLHDAGISRLLPNTTITSVDVQPTTSQPIVTSAPTGPKEIPKKDKLPASVFKMRKANLKNKTKSLNKKSTIPTKISRISTKKVRKSKGPLVSSSNLLNNSNQEKVALNNENNSSEQNQGVRVSPKKISDVEIPVAKTTVTVVSENEMSENICLDSIRINRVMGDENNNRPVSLKQDVNGTKTSPKKKKKKSVKLGVFICQKKKCSIRFNSEENLKTHLKCHLDETYGFACCECEYRSDHWSSTAGHLWRQHKMDLELHKCEFCIYRSYSLSTLENIHKKIHSAEKNYVCSICQKGFKNQKQLVNHKARHAPKAPLTSYQDVKPTQLNPPVDVQITNPSIDSDGKDENNDQLKDSSQMKSESKNVCELCSKIFVDPRAVRLHMNQVHKKMRPYLCSSCGYHSASRGALRTHIRSHTGEKPFKCDACKYETSDHNSLRRHKMRHSGERPYKCPFCDYACIQVCLTACIADHRDSRLTLFS